MADHWKSTPSYWCKFCSIYVRDTPGERKNHEASGKHQGAIQKNLRELEKTKNQEERQRQRAKDEVARLNGLVGGGIAAGTGTKPTMSGLKDVGRTTAAPKVSTAAQRKAHAEQLLALGVELPDELKREVTGVGGWQTVSERVVEDDEAPRTLAQMKQEGESKDDITPDALARGVHKRKIEDEEDEAAPARRAWGSKVKSYPGGGSADDSGDLDTLLSGVTKKKAAEVKTEESEEKPQVKREESAEDKPLDALPDVETPEVKVKAEDSAAAAPAVVFKKRKVKK